MKIVIVQLIFLFLFSVDNVQADNFTGTWSGVARSDSEETHLSLTIKQVGKELSASMGLTNIGVSGWPAHSVEMVKDRLKVTFLSDSGLQEMYLSREGQFIRGTWQENKFVNAALIELSLVPSQQLFQEQRIFVNGPAGKIGASLIVPHCPGGCAGVVFLHGSGPQTRDSNRFAAQTFAKQGIASLIYDKRGVAESEGDLSNVTFDDLAEDAIVVADVLRQHLGISKVGFFGHSQGGWVAPLAGSKWKNTAFIITSAGPAVSPAREAEWDAVRQLRATNTSQLHEQVARKFIQRWHNGIRTGEWADHEQALRAIKKQSWFESADFTPFMTRPDEVFARSYRKFMDYNPMPALKSLKSPLLAILSSDDESIDAEETILILNSLESEGFDIRLIIYPGFDHSLHRKGAEGSPIRWPNYPDDYFSVQTSFIKEIGVSIGPSISIEADYERH